MDKRLREALAVDLRPERVQAFKVGDSVRVHVRVTEGEKERVQVFSGIVIARKGTGSMETFTVRRISFGVGVEKIFPVHSPSIERLEVARESVVLRAKLYYMRQRIGKQAMKVREKAAVHGQ
ncbi:MAG: 50S ribosomal protein L19 [Puniceicoccales bacterium]|jgi:large subunit ribosomal protein L19|nr:50S ribosomal protein L19 [Puniceicoccales bacterium]